MKNRDFFKEITRPEEKDKIIQDFVNSGHEIFTKLSSGKILTLKPYLLKMNSFLCHNKEKHGSEVRPISEGIHNFFMNSERYFFKGLLQQEGENYEIYFDGQLFQLQRRQTYRVNIPESYKGRFLLQQINEIRVRHECRIMDLSLGGCALEVIMAGKGNSDEFSCKQEDKIFGEFFMKNENLFESGLIVKRVKKQKISNKTSVVLGAEFYPSNTAFEQKIFTLTLDIHRELYGRLL